MLQLFAFLREMGVTIIAHVSNTFGLLGYVLIDFRSYYQHETNYVEFLYEISRNILEQSQDL
jgi:hypothetical protein